MLNDGDWELNHLFYNVVISHKHKSLEIQIEEYFNFIEQNFDRIKITSDFTNLILIFKKILCTCQSQQRTPIDVSDIFVEIFHKHKETEADLLFILLLLYQILNIVEQHQLQYIIFNEKLFNEMVEFLFKNEHPKLNSNIIVCLQLFVTKFEAGGFLKNLWNLLLKSNDESKILPEFLGQILLLLHDEFCWAIDNFIFNEEIIGIIKRLISSNLQDERKAGRYLLKKQYTTLITNKDKKELSDFLKTFLTIVDNVEENQSHLILPSLDILNDINFKQFEDWLEILYKLLLQHNNILVKKWTIEYILKQYSVADLSLKTLHQFLIALNNVSLYNREGYFIPVEKISYFLQREQEKFLKCFASIKWKSVPLHFWLNEVNSSWNKVDNISNATFLQIATIVRIQNNPKIREKLRLLFQNIFEPIIIKLSIDEYITYMETLYNLSDKFTEMNEFVDKLSNCTKIYKNAKISQRSYEILTNYLSDDVIHLMESTLLKYLKKVKPEQHSWFRFIIVFHFTSNEANRFCRNVYDIDIDALSKATLQKITSQLIEKLAYNNEEVPFVRKKCIDFYVMRRKNLKLNDLITSSSNCPYKIETLLDKGSHTTLFCLSNLLANFKDEISTNILDAFMKTMHDYGKHEMIVLSTIKSLLEYLKIKPKNIATNYAEKILKNNLGDFNITYEVLESGYPLSKETYINGLMLSNAKTGDARIEHIYTYNAFATNNLINVRKLYLKYLPKSLRKSEFLMELLSMNEEISKNHPRYYENSTEHRLKIRIATTILHLKLYYESISSFWHESLWDILFKQNNQLNIVLMYELLIGICAPSLNIVMEKLEKINDYTCSQQVSIISVANIYVVYNFSQLSIVLLTSFINTIFPLTMGSNFQVRNFAQLVLFKILTECSKRNVSIPNIGRLCNAIAKTIIDPMKGMLYDIRLKNIDYYLLYSSKNLPIYEIILYTTHASYDEYQDFEEHLSKLKTLRTHFIDKQLKTKMNESDQEVPLNDIKQSILQRKMNPNDISVQKATLNQINSEMFVVATLVEKLANLGGIARTCEVIGIKNLIINSIKHIEKSDFQNLSMTAEKSLNITEVNVGALMNYLMEKKSEGFSIIGAEQTDKSVSLIDFPFPKKCVLLLGHEKTGIPANILSLLDCAVEIPQFGLVRSLNVHVSGALFMWEYSKQHLKQ